MNRVNARAHGILDYVTIFGLIVLPFIVGLPMEARWVCAALALVHLIMTRLTNFHLGAAKLIPFPWHGWVELAVSVGLVAASLMPALPFDTLTRRFFQAVAGVIFVVWLLSDYRSAQSEHS